jgi:hypothetical protein
MTHTNSYHTVVLLHPKVTVDQIELLANERLEVTQLSHGPFYTLAMMLDKFCFTELAFQDSVEPNS